MKFFPDPQTLQARLRDPLSWAGLAIDLLPIWAVIAWGWKASPLVVLYWLENGIIGLWALARMLAFGLVQGVGALLASLFMSTFFIFHFGMFWFVHGIFVQLLTGTGGEENSGQSSIEDGPFALAIAALQNWNGMTFLALMLFSWGGVLFVGDYLLRGEVNRTDLGQEMAAPYGRVIVLHIGLFAGFFALQAIGEPAVGVLLLILLHAGWNFLTRLKPRAAATAAVPGD
jgi:hypothetical protein